MVDADLMLQDVALPSPLRQVAYELMAVAEGRAEGMVGVAVLVSKVMPGTKEGAVVFLKQLERLKQAAERAHQIGVEALASLF
jgi:hypothetical protein